MVAIDWKQSLVFFQRAVQPDVLGRIASVVNGILLLLLSYTLASFTWALLPSAEQEYIDFDEVTATSSNTPNRVTRGQSIVDAAKWHLFGKAGAIVAKLQQRTEDVPETTLKLELRGVLASDDPKIARAIIADATRKENFYALESMLPGNAILKEIYVDRIVLSRNNRLETLRLPTERLASGSGSTLARTQAKTPNQAPAQQTRFDPQAGLGQLRNTLLNDPQSLMGLMQASPQKDSNGKIVGYKMGAGQDPRMLRRFGLRRGDIVTSVNGVQLDGPTRLPELLRILPTAEEVKIEYKRRGKSRSVVLNMNE